MRQEPRRGKGSPSRRTKREQGLGVRATREVSVDPLPAEETESRFGRRRPIGTPTDVPGQGWSRTGHPYHPPPPTRGCSPFAGCDVHHLGAEGVVGAGFGVFGPCRVPVWLVSGPGGMVFGGPGWGWMMLGTWRVGPFRVSGLWGFGSLVVPWGAGSGCLPLVAVTTVRRLRR